MKTIEEHRVILRKIAHTAFTTGINSLTEEQVKRHPNLSKEEYSPFIQKCHDGYKAAQKMIIQEIIEYQDLLPQVKANLKEGRRKRDKTAEENATIEIDIIEHRIKTFTHVADGMAWIMIGGEIHIARRFHIGEWEVKQLKSSNLEHAMEVADKINNDPDEFALLSDLTGFMQIGDLLVKSKKGNIIIELKEGKINNEISELLAKLKAEDEVLDEIKLSEKYDKNTIKQVKRVERQRERMERARDVLKNDQGINPANGHKIRVFTPRILTEKYFQELEELHLVLDEKNWSYGVVDSCLLIGMYKDEMINKGGPYIIQELLKEKNSIIIDWQSITNTLSEPIFSKPLTPRINRKGESGYGFRFRHFN